MSLSYNKKPHEKYVWFVRGQFINILEVDDDGSLVPPKEEISFIRSGAGTEGDPYLYGGIELEVTRVPNITEDIDDESDPVPVVESLEEAVIDYVKAQLSDDAMDPKFREYFMNRFRRKVSRFGTTRTGGARVAMGTGWMR